MPSPSATTSPLSPILHTLPDFLGEGRHGAVFARTNYTCAASGHIDIAPFKHPTVHKVFKAAHHEAFLKEVGMARLLHSSGASFKDFCYGVRACERATAEWSRRGPVSVLELPALPPGTVSVKHFEGALTPAQAHALVVVFVKHVQFLHTHKIIHGDLHPKNVWIVPTGSSPNRSNAFHILISDFGEARRVPTVLAEDDAKRMTSTLRKIWSYVRGGSPKAQRAFSGWCAVFPKRSLGVSLGEWATLRDALLEPAAAVTTTPVRMRQRSPGEDEAARATKRWMDGWV